MPKGISKLASILFGRKTILSIIANLFFLFLFFSNAHAQYSKAEYELYFDKAYGVKSFCIATEEDCLNIYDQMSKRDLNITKSPFIILSRGIMGDSVYVPQIKSIQGTLFDLAINDDINKFLTNDKLKPAIDSVVLDVKIDSFYKKSF